MKPFAEIIPIKKEDLNEYEPLFDARGKKIPCFSRYKKTGVIYFRKKFKKFRIPPLEFSTEEKTIGRARTRAEIEIQKHKNKYLGIDDSKIFGRRIYVSIREAGEWVLNNHTPNQRNGTQENHKIYIPQIIDVIGNQDVNSLNSESSLSEVIQAIKKKKRVSKTGKLLPGRRTFIDYAKALNLISRYAYQNKWATHLVKFKNPDKKKETGRLLSRNEVVALWEVMNEDMRDQFVLALECVMRLREAICAPWTEVNLETGEWTLPAERVKTGSKTGRGRSFIISPNGLSRLRVRFQKRDKRSPWIFPSPANYMKPIQSTKTAWKTAKAKAKIEGSCRWHDLRHTGLTWMLLGDPDATSQEKQKMIRLPVLVSAYAGVSMKTIESVYLKRRSSQTIDVSHAVRIY